MLPNRLEQIENLRRRDAGHKTPIHMDRVKVKIINKSHHPLPSYGTFEAAGMDVRAFLPEGPVTLKAGDRALIPTGLYIQLPQGYECQIRPRSVLR